jgi:hypothetical protein
MDCVQLCRSQENVGYYPLEQCVEGNDDLRSRGRIDHPQTIQD